MFTKVIKGLFKIALFAALLGILTLLIPRLFTELYAASRIYTIENVPAHRAAIVFGAGLLRDGTPTPVLKDRVAAAVDLYHAGKVEKILMSGDNRFINYNEPAAMRQFALELGVPADDIVLDFAGRRTYDTCYRANAIFGLHEAIVVTQRFHLDRAIFLCNQLGVLSVGIEADNRYYRKISRLTWNTRELFATVGALYDVYLGKPLPVLGNFEPIFPELP